MEFIALRVGKITIKVSFQRLNNYLIEMLFSGRALESVFAESRGVLV